MLKDKILNILQGFDALYEGFYTWLAGQYDHTYGGFYYAGSSKTSPEFQPDIESTGQALHILDRSNLIQEMPLAMKERIIAFFQKRQVPDGYFYDFHNNMREVDRMVARAVMYSVGSLRRLGAKPLYPVPGSKGMKSLPYYMKSLTIFRQWMDERPWDYAWMACDNVSATAVYIEALPENERNAFLNLIWEYLEEHQDPEMGMWGGGRPYVKLSGAFKLTGLYRRFARPMPRAERLYQSVLKTIREDVSEDMCWTRNTMDLLAALKPQLGPFPPEDVLEIMMTTYRNLKQYLKPDGGFSRHVKNSLAVPNNVPLGKGLAEGDMNAGTQALRIRSLCHEIIDLPEQPLTQYTEGFYDKIEK